MNNSAPIDKLKELFESMNLKIYDKTSISQKKQARGNRILYKKE